MNKPLSELIIREQKKAQREYLEKTFALHMKSAGINEGWVTEYQFHAVRKWRFDFANPDIKLAIEIEGGTASGKSRHSKGSGFEQDAEKYNTAEAMGWTLFRFTSSMVTSGQAILFVQDYLKTRAGAILSEKTLAEHT